MTDTEWQAGAEEPVADGGRVITIGWQLVLLPVLAVAAVVGGILVGRQYAASRQAAAPPAQAAAANAAAPVLGAGSGDVVREFEMGAPSGLIEIDAGPPAGDAGSSMPGIAPDQVVELPPSIHVLRGQSAPALEMLDLATGETVSLSDYAGRPVLVNFWATWCPPCRLEMPWLQSVADKYADRGFVVLAVNAGERVAPDATQDHIQSFVASTGLRMPVLHGDNTYDVQRAWTVIGLPASFLVASDGTVADVHTGAYPNEPSLDAHVQQILADQ